jgi:hypothetical protein
MAEPDARSVSITPWLVGLVLLVAVAAVLIAFVPIAECSLCNGKGDINYRGSWGGDAMPILPCHRCAGSGRLSFFKRWSYRTADPQ